MKIKERALALLLSAVMVLAFMPALAFAETEDTVPAELLTEAEAESASSDEANAGEVFSDTNGLLYELKIDGTVELIYINMEKEEILYNLTSMTIPATLIVGGISYSVTSIGEAALYGFKNLKEVTIASTITSIGLGAFGYYYDDVAKEDKKVEGFTIIGKTGSAAQKYANDNGFAFRDPEAEAAAAQKAKEDARNGIPDKKIPKMKIGKPKAGKKSATVTWTKLSKKQLKKSKANGYEVWVCRNKGFAMGETSEHIVKKSKRGLKITKMPKGTYWVKVRAIRKVGAVKYVGKWSKLKKVVVKK